jgi:hypothetical protein
VDSKIVNAEIRSEVRPVLRRAGFERSTDRTYWRYHDDRADVINFQSFNSYNAGVMGISTYSFAVNLGCYLKYIPNQYPHSRGAERLEGDRPRPKEYECQLRGRLNRSYRDASCSDSKIWFIDSLGTNLSRAIHDVLMVLNRDGLPWFDRFTTPASVFDILLGDEEMGRLWGFGQPGSPIRTYMLGYAARAAGNLDAAVANLTIAASTKSFESIRERILADASLAV